MAGRAADATYVVECYSPADPTHGPAAVALRIRSAVADLRARGERITWLGAVLIPDDDIAFHLFNAPDAAVVQAVARIAALTGARTAGAILLGGPQLIGTMEATSVRRAAPSRR
jgi:hypothetical protein